MYIFCIQHCQMRLQTYIQQWWSRSLLVSWSCPILRLVIDIVQVLIDVPAERAVD